MENEAHQIGLGNFSPRLAALVLVTRLDIGDGGRHGSEFCEWGWGRG